MTPAQVFLIGISHFIVHRVNYNRPQWFQNIVIKGHVSQLVLILTTVNSIADGSLSNLLYHFSPLLSAETLLTTSLSPLCQDAGTLSHPFYTARTFNTTTYSAARKEVKR